PIRGWHLVLLYELPLCPIGRGCAVPVPDPVTLLEDRSLQHRRHVIRTPDLRVALAILADDLVSVVFAGTRLDSCRALHVTAALPRPLIPTRVRARVRVRPL